MRKSPLTAFGKISPVCLYIQSLYQINIDRARFCGEKVMRRKEKSGAENNTAPTVDPCA